ncbi:MAG: translocation/assembly module TamB domain-containing protein [Steroidobacter sp.]
MKNSLMKKRIVIVVLIVLLLAAGALWWLCYTQAGLRFALSQLNHIPNTSIKMNDVSGRLAGPLHIGSFELDDDHVHIAAKQIDLDLHPSLLLSGWVAVRGTIDQATVILKYHAPSSSSTPVRFLPHFLHIYSSSLTINHASFTHYNGFNIQAAPVKTGLRLSRRHLVLNNIDVQGEWFAAQGSFHLDTGRTLTLNSQLNATLKAATGAALHGTARMKGDTSRLNFAADIQQPGNAHATATLSFPDHHWLMSGHAESARWLLTPWLHNAPLSFRKGNFDYTLDDAGLHVKGDVTVPEWAASPLHVNADAQFAREAGHHVIVLKRTDISNAVSHVETHTTGSIVLTGAQPVLDLRSNWSYMQWPIATPASTYFHSQRGTATLQGAMSYQFTVDADLSTADVNDSSLIASGMLAADRIDITHFDWRVWNGELRGSVQLGFAQPRDWQFDVQATDVDPSSVLQPLPGHISFAAHGKGNDLDHLATDFDISLLRLDGRLRQQPIHAQGRVVRHTSEWLADHLNIRWADASLTTQGSAGAHNDVLLHFDAPALQRFQPDVQGQLSLQGSLRGTREQPHLALQMQSDTLAYGPWKTHDLHLDTSIDLSDATASHLLLSAKQLARGDVSLSQLIINAQGQAAAHDITAQALIDTPATSQQQLKMSMHGEYRDQIDTHRHRNNHMEWLGQLTQLDVLDTQLRAALDHPAELRIDRDMQTTHTQLSLHDFCVHVDQGHACASADWQNDGQWNALASINQLPLSLEHAVNDEVTRVTATVNATLDLHRKLNQPWLGSARLDLADGAVRYQLAGHDEVLPITLGTAQMTANAHAVTASASLHIASDTVADFNAGANRNDDDMNTWPLSGRLAIRSEDAKLVPVFVHEVDHAGGVLSSEVSIAGTLGTPALSGTIQLSKGELDFYRWNLSLRELQLNAQLNDEHIQFTAQGNAGQGTMNASGDLNWYDGLNGKLQLGGDHLLIADSPEYHVLATPNLTFDINHINNSGVITVSGDVLIPSAKLQPQSFSNAVQISPDAHFKDDELYSRSSAWQVDSNVKVKLGDDVHFDGMGLQGQLNGEVSTRVRTGVAASGRGELGINDGQYEAYGRKLDIKRGRLLFDNTPLDNPGLDIQAERVINDPAQGDITVGVYVRGVLRNPRLAFYSDPSMSQTQIVSYLVVGKPLDQLQGQETTTVRSATSSLALQGGGYLAAQLGHRIGLEEVGVETDGNNQSSLVLGKFLSPRLYVSYGISLTQAINTLKLRYTLSKHWTIKTEAGEAKSADVEFKIDR